MTAHRPRISARFLDLVARHYLRKPDQAELLRIKFPDPTSLLHGALNEGAYRLGSERGARLTTLNVEVTNRCNLRCSYCPVNRSLARPKTDLPFDRFIDILDRSPTVKTLLPFQWGEPLMHPRMIDMIEVAAKRGIRTYLTTNGTFLDRPTRDALLRSGLTRLTISVDGDDETHHATRGVDLAPIRERVRALCSERDALGAEMRVDVSMVVDDRTAPGLDAYRAAWTPVVDRVQAIPRMIEGARQGACREPWRGLLVVLADGRVTTCCADSEGVLDLGDAFSESPAEIFNGERMRALRRAHRCGDLPAVCATCDEHRDPAVSPRFR